MKDKKMNTKDIHTVIYSTTCVARCNVLPLLRPDKQGGIEAYIPADENGNGAVGEWVKGLVEEDDGIITLTCEPTMDDFRAVFVATIEQYNEAWQAGSYHKSGSSRVPRSCGPCRDNPTSIAFNIHTDGDHFLLSLNGTTYQFQQDQLYGKEHVTEHMVRLVQRYMDSRTITVVTDSSFFDILQQAIDEMVVENKPQA